MRHLSLRHFEDQRLSVFLLMCDHRPDRWPGVLLPHHYLLQSEIAVAIISVLGCTIVDLCIIYFTKKLWYRMHCYGLTHVMHVFCIHCDETTCCNC